MTNNRRPLKKNNRRLSSSERKKAEDVYFQKVVEEKQSKDVEVVETLDTPTPVVGKTRKRSKEHKE